MNRKKFREGLRDGLPIALGYLAVSFGIGISYHTAGISAFQGFLMSLLNNASAGEYGGITVITENSGVFMMVLMTLIINARYLLMSCALSQRLHPDTPLVHRLLIGFDVTDELFGIAIAQEGFLNFWYFFGAMCAALPGWSLGTLLGAVAGNLLPAVVISALGLAIYAMFIAIVLPKMKKHRPTAICVAIAVALSCAFYYIPLLQRVPSGFSVILCAVIAAAVMALLRPIKGGSR